MEGNVDKCLAFCQALVASNHQFTFTLNIGKDNAFSFSTYDLARDLKKAAPKPQNRRDRRASNPAVKQKAAAYAAAASAGQAAAGAPVQSPAAWPEMGGAAGPARAPAEEAKREPCCRKCKRPVASHPGGTRGCGTSCTNTVLTPEKLLHRSTPGNGEPRTLTPVRGERRDEIEVNNTTDVEEIAEESPAPTPAPATIQEKAEKGTQTAVDDECQKPEHLRCGQCPSCQKLIIECGECEFKTTNSTFLELHRSMEHKE
jgi:hypothetical protein